MRVRGEGRGEEKLRKCEFTARQKQTNSGPIELYCTNSTKLEMHGMNELFRRRGCLLSFTCRSTQYKKPRTQ